DVDPPVVTINGVRQGSELRVSVNATDAGSGVKRIFYSLDETHYQLYTGPLTVDPNQTSIIRAFADDNLANRSSVIVFYPSLSNNPADNPQFFVRQHYFDFLNRTPDSSGLSFWANEITLCGTDQTCIEQKRINVSGAFYLSIEFQQTGYLVERIYKAAYGDSNGISTFNGTHQLAVPAVRFNELLTDSQSIGQNVVVGQNGWEALLESNKQAFLAAFVQRARFTGAYPGSLTPAAFVDLLFSNSGLVPSSSERQAAIDEFAGALTSADNAARAKALRRVAENATLVQQEYNRAFVLMQYFGYLRRNPNDAPDADYTGYDFWLTKLNHFDGNFVTAEMVKAFIVSSEYRQRFGP
ncbi:MAG TPA: hypothetical protein VI306_04830, partial [Pyrinomonadaceae bacterium]